MVSLNKNKLRQELIDVFSAYLKDPTDFKMKMKARRMHQNYGNAGEAIDKYMRAAVHLLVDIGYDLESPPKPPKEAVESLVLALATRKA